MGVLRFTASGSNRLKWTTLATPAADLSDGAWTAAALVKFPAADADFDAITYCLSGTGNGTVEAGFSLDNTENLVVDIASQPASGTALTGSAVYIVVAKKAAGTVRPTYSWKPGSGGAWVHSAPGGGSTLPDQIDATMLEVGAWQNGDFFDGHIGLIGWWDGVMTNPQVEALGTNWQTSDWWTHAFGAPAVLLELNVIAASVVDLAGNLTTTAHVGTSLDAAETLNSWNFDGTGGGGPSSFNQAATDAIGLADAATRTSSRARGATDTLGIAEAVAGTVGRPRGATDALAITDAATATLGRTVGATDAIGLSEAATRTLTLPRAVADAIGLAEAVTGPVGRPRGATDAIGVTDAATRSAALHPRALTDALGVSDSATSNGGGIPPASTPSTLPTTGAG